MKIRNRPPLNARKQPIQERSRETVGIILEAAARVLERDGLAGYNTNAIAERAGVSVGSIYQYFPNKDALTLALIAKFERELLETVRTAVGAARGSDLRTSLRLFIRSLLDGHHSSGDLNRLLEVEEDRLRRLFPDPHAARELQKITASLLEGHRAELGVAVNLSTVEDVITITRAMVDAALMGGRTGHAAERRILRAIEGYLR